MRRVLVLCLVVTGCGGGSSHVSTELPGHLVQAPVVLVVLESGGVLDWQKERDEVIVDRLGECLPTVLSPLCPGECTVALDPVDEPHVVLTVRTHYLASAHFMHGFRVEVEYEIWDRYKNEKLVGFKYHDEPLGKVMADEDADRDEVLTYDSAKTADRFCQDVGTAAGELGDEE